MKKLICLLILFPITGFSQNITIDVNPKSGQSPLDVTVTWSTSQVTDCVASGGWSGNKNTNGSELIRGLTQNTVFTLNCRYGDNFSFVSWTAPTQMVNGSNIPETGPDSLKGYNIYNSITLDDNNPSVTFVDKNTLSYLFTNQSNNRQYFWVTAVNMSNEESEKAGPVYKDINSQLLSNEIAATIEAVLTLKLNEPIIYTIVKGVNKFIFLPVGTAPVGTLCLDTFKINEYNVVPRENVTWSGSVKPDVVVGKCLLN